MIRKWNRPYLLPFFVLMVINIVMADQNFKVSGIMMGNQPVAIVNGQAVGKGDNVDGAIVEAITNDSVILKYQGNDILTKIEDNSPSDPQATVNIEQQPNQSQVAPKEDENKFYDDDGDFDLLMKNMDLDVSAYLFKSKKKRLLYRLVIWNKRDYPIPLNYFDDKFTFVEFVLKFV